MDKRPISIHDTLSYQLKRDISQLLKRDFYKTPFSVGTVYGAANVSRMPFPAFFDTNIRFFHTIGHAYRSVWPAKESKPRFGAEFVQYVLRMIVKPAY